MPFPAAIQKDAATPTRSSFKADCVEHPALQLFLNNGRARRPQIHTETVLGRVV